MNEETELPFEAWNQLPDRLKRSAYRTSNEAAWQRQDALSVVEFLQSLDYGILGVDIWIPTSAAPTIPHKIYDLDLSSLTVEEWGNFVEMSCKEAVNFISNFEFDADDKEVYGAIEPVFNILPMNESET